MKKIIIYSLLSCLPIIFCGQPSNAFEYESWPFEGMPYFRVKVDTLILLKKPKETSGVAMRQPVRKGSILTFPYGVKELLMRYEEPGMADEKENPDLINKNISLKDSIQKAVKPGIFRAVKAGHFRGYIVGENGKIIKTRNEPKEQSFTYKKGDLIEELLYLGEGVCLFKFNGTIIEQEGCFSEQTDIEKSLVHESESQSEWWVSVAKDNKVLGWLRLDNADSPLDLLETIK